MPAFYEIRYTSIVSTTADSDSVIIEVSNPPVLSEVHLPRIATQAPAYELKIPNNQTNFYETTVSQDAFILRVLYPSAATQTAHLAILKTLFIEHIIVGNSTAANQVTQTNILQQIRDNQVDGDQIVSFKNGLVTQFTAPVTAVSATVLPLNPDRKYLSLYNNGPNVIHVNFSGPATMADLRLRVNFGVVYEASYVPVNELNARTVSGNSNLIVVHA